MKCENCIHHAVCALYTFSGYNSDECGFYETRRPHGEWETCIDTEYCKCSYCGNVVMLEESVRFHFCPNCGADMRRRGGSE